MRQICRRRSNSYRGSVFDETMGDEMRVTVVATGLGAPLARKQPKPEVVYRGEEAYQRTGTHDERSPT